MSYRKIFIVILYLLPTITTWSCYTLSTCTSCLNDQTCSICNLGYGLDYTSLGRVSCNACQLSACLNCASNAYTCDQCMNPLGLALTTDAFGIAIYTCSPCANSVCVNCHLNATICL